MKINTKMSVGLKFVNVLKNNGIVRLEDAAEQIGTTQAFLEQIARKLRLGKVVKVIRGPGGGQVLYNKNVTAYDVALCLNEIPMPKSTDDKDTSELKNRIQEVYRNYRLF